MPRINRSLCPNLGHLLDQMGRGEDAIATFRALVKVQPAEARNIGCLATTLLARQQREEGIKTLDQAIAAARETIGRRPSDTGEYHLLGGLLAVRGDQVGAIAAYREALGIEPSHTGALTNLVTILRNRGDQDGKARSPTKAGHDSRSVKLNEQAVDRRGDGGEVSFFRGLIAAVLHVADADLRGVPLAAGGLLELVEDRRAILPNLISRERLEAPHDVIALGVHPEVIQPDGRADRHQDRVLGANRRVLVDRKVAARGRRVPEHVVADAVRQRRVT